MKIEELEDVDGEIDEGQNLIVRVDAKRVLVSAGARILFYPTRLYKVFRNKIQAEFRWWDKVDQAVHEYSNRQLSKFLCHSSSGDEVLITKADLDDCNSSFDDNNIGEELAVVPKVSHLRPMICHLS